MKTSFTTDELRTRVIDALGITRPETLAAIKTMSRERLEGMLENLQRKSVARTEAKVSGEVVHGFLQCESRNPGDTTAMVGQEDIITCPTCIDRHQKSQLPAPQSPVVPGVEELDDAVDQSEKTWTLSGANKLGPKSTFIASRLHAYLLANARESREDRYREALERIERALLVVDYKPESETMTIKEIVREALATVGKEG